LTLSGVSHENMLDDYAFKPDLVVDSVAELDIKKVLKLK
jgi:NagD protein